MVVIAAPEHGSGSHGSPKRLTLGLLISMSSLVALFAKRASRVSHKLKPRLRRNDSPIKEPVVLSPKSPMISRPKQLLTQISNKLLHHRSRKKGEEEEEEEEEFGDGGVWQKEILMGDKCQPLDFSGVIYYDSQGKLLNEVRLRSPRASPLPSYLTHLPNNLT